MGIDVWEVLDAASTKPFGFMRFNPGPGWGGHCIPLDPFYLAWKAREYGRRRRSSSSSPARSTSEMPHYVVEKLQLALNDRGQGRARAAGSWSSASPTRRTSTTRARARRSRSSSCSCSSGAASRYHDPHVPRAPRMRSWPDLPPMASQPLTPELLAAQDAVVIVTDHTAVDYALVAAPRAARRRHARRLPGAIRQGREGLMSRDRCARAAGEISGPRSSYSRTPRRLRNRSVRSACFPRWMMRISCFSSRNEGRRPSSACASGPAARRRPCGSGWPEPRVRPSGPSGSRCISCFGLRSGSCRSPSGGVCFPSGIVTLRWWARWRSLRSSCARSSRP